MNRKKSHLSKSARELIEWCNATVAQFLENKRDLKDLKNEIEEEFREADRLLGQLMELRQAGNDKT